MIPQLHPSESLAASCAPKASIESLPSTPKPLSGETPETDHMRKRREFMASLPPAARGGFAYLNGIVDNLYAEHDDDKGRFVKRPKRKVAGGEDGE